MKEEKLKRLITVLAVILVLILINKSGIFTRKTSSLPKDIGAYKSNFQKVISDKKEVQEDTDNKKEERAIEIDVSKLSWGKNIFAPLVKSNLGTTGIEEIMGTAVEDLKLTGWAQKGRDLIAVISDNLVRVGDELADKKVILIEKDRVMLQDKAGENYIVTYASDETIDQGED